jgi:S1-C subfamily serine protease
MKKNIIAIVLILASPFVQAQSLNLQGKLTNMKDAATVSLIDGVSNKELVSGKSTAGNFILQTKLEFPSLLVLSIEGVAQKIPVFIGNENVLVEGDVKKIPDLNITGSVSHDVYKVYMNALNPKMMLYVGNMQAASTEKNTTKKDALNTAAATQSKEIIAIFNTLSKANAGSPVTTLMLLQFSNIFPEIKENLASIYETLAPSAKKGPFAEFIDKTIASSAFGQIGSKLPDFTQNDVNGKPFTLSSLKGKYVLVDFWASWCGPCRAENPNIVKVFNKYKAKNFTVLGVSLDQDKAKWLEAIKKDSLAWNHVSDLKYWNNAVAAQFGIQSIPASFLIDPTGKIVARDLRGFELEKFISSILMDDLDKSQDDSNKKPDWKGNGSGFFINENGFIATNYHVIKNAKLIQVEYYQKGEKLVYNAKVIVSDKQNDLAIIKISDSGFKKLSMIPYFFGDANVEVGTEIFALGYPIADVMGTEIKFTDGKISAKTGADNDIRVYQISAPIQPGNSGGPLFDKNGKLVGITSSALNKEYFNTENVNYAIKISYLKSLIDVLHEEINLPKDLEISKKSLTEKIKILSDFVPLIRIK